LAAKVWRYCESNDIAAETVTVKSRFADFQIITRSRTVPGAFPDAALIDAVTALLAAADPFRKPVRLLGVTLSGLGQAHRAPAAQLELRL
jgi:DNA polymerase-4